MGEISSVGPPTPSKLIRQKFIQVYHVFNGRVVGPTSFSCHFASSVTDISIFLTFLAHMSFCAAEEYSSKCAVGCNVGTPLRIFECLFVIEIHI
jgi:hypothetical protein